MTRTPITSRRFVALVFAAAGCAGLTACGSSGKPSQSAARASSGIRFSQCMRTHGVPNFPDPSSQGGIQIPQGTNPFSPSFKAAQAACGRLMPFGRPRSPQSSAQAHEQLVRISQCMRAHGITSFPDPTSSPPTGPPAGGGVAMGTPGGFLIVPASLMQSPGFQQDAKACNFGAGGPPPGKGVKSIGGK